MTSLEHLFANGWIKQVSVDSFIGKRVCSTIVATVADFQNRCGYTSWWSIVGFAELLQIVWE